MVHTLFPTWCPRCPRPVCQTTGDDLNCCFDRRQNSLGLGSKYFHFFGFILSYTLERHQRYLKFTPKRFCTLGKCADINRRQPWHPVLPLNNERSPCEGEEEATEAFGFVIRLYAQEVGKIRIHSTRNARIHPGFSTPFKI